MFLPDRSSRFPCCLASQGHHAKGTVCRGGVIFHWRNTADKRLQELCANDPPFEMKRMAYGGFSLLAGS
jgi:hypothetical protein